MVDLKQYLTFLTDNALTPRQFLFLHCLYSSKRDNSIYKLMGKFTESAGVIINGRKRFMTDEEREDLVKRRFVTVNNEGKKASDYEVQPKFLDIFIDSYTAVQEYMAAYPGFVTINGSRIPLMKCNRMELELTYYKSIRGSRKKHEEVIEVILKGKEKGMINMNITNFTEANFWDKLQEELNEINKSNNSNDFHYVAGSF